MSPVLLISLIIVLPVVVLTLLRVNATFVFLSLCLGSVLVQFMGIDAISLITTIFPHASAVSENSIEIGILLVPAALTIIFMFHSVKGIRLILNILPAFTVGLLAVLLVQPLLSPGLQGTLTHSVIWHDYMRAESLVVGVAALVNLLFLWMNRRHHAAREKGSKRH